MPNNEVLSRAGIPSMYTLLRQRRLRWLGHTHRMADGRISKDPLYGELATLTRSRGRPKLRFKHICKRDMKACNMNTETWEASADDRTTWKQLVSQELDSGEKAVRAANDGKKRSQTESLHYHTTVYSLCLSVLQQTLLFQNWPLQSLKMLFFIETPVYYSIVFKRLKDANNTVSIVIEIKVVIGWFKLRL